MKLSGLDSGKRLRVLILLLFLIIGIGKAFNDKSFFSIDRSEKKKRFQSFQNHGNARIRQSQVISSLDTKGQRRFFSIFSKERDLIEKVTVETSFALGSKRKHSIQFAAPLLDYGYPPTVKEFLCNQAHTTADTSREESDQLKPILLYLPGFDGTYICPFIQFPELGTDFEVWCMTIAMDDRSTYDEIKICVLDFIDYLGNANAGSSPVSIPNVKFYEEFEKMANDAISTGISTNGMNDENIINEPTNKETESESSHKRQLFIVGESFGGILASDVALSLLQKGSEASLDLKGLTLVNPATCYSQSQLAAKGPSVTKLPAAFYPFGLAGLLPLFADEYSTEQLFLILQAKALPSVIDDPMREAYMGRVAFSLPFQLEYMSQGTLTWRLEEWLTVGCKRMEDRVKDFRLYPSFRALLIVGEKDLTLPSIAEAERLKELLPNVQTHVVEGAGHASTCGSRLDITAQLRNRFSELLRLDDDKSIKEERTSDGNISMNAKRSSMKDTAASGSGPYYGMEPRYDGANIGLNPILYWSKDNYVAIQKTDTERQIHMSESRHMQYKISMYGLNTQ